MFASKNPRKKWNAEQRRAFAEKMRRARAAKRGRKRNPGKVHTAAFDRCVKKVRRKSKRANPYAVCTASLGKRAIVKRHRRTRTNPSHFIRVHVGHKVYYFARDNILSTSIGAAKRFRSFEEARRIARELSARVPSNFRVYVVGSHLNA